MSFCSVWLCVSALKQICSIVSCQERNTQETMRARDKLSKVRAHERSKKTNALISQISNDVSRGVNKPANICRNFVRTVTTFKICQLSLVLEMSKRKDEIDWSKLANASPKPKRLHLEEDDSDGLFHCPVQACNHDGFITQRGCRKHVTNKHRWYFYFDEKPNNTQIEACQGNENETNDQKSLRKVRTVASFDMSSDIAGDFLSWLTGSGGGCKSDR